MLFSNKRQKELAKQVEKGQEAQNYWAIVRRQFNKNRLAKMALRFLYLFVFIAVFGDFIANERPLYCELDGQSHFPVFKQYLVDCKLANWEDKFRLKKWLEQDYDYAIFPPISYSPNTKNYRTGRYLSPFGKQKLEQYESWHYMGTDHLGRDIASGMIHGTRTAMLVGIITMSIASLIGIFLGALAGYFGDNRFRLSRIRLWLNLLALFFFIFFAFIVRGYSLNDHIKEGALFTEIAINIGLFLAIFSPANLLCIPLKKIKFLGKKILIPLDILIMRFIEIINSVPLLILLLAILPLLQTPSLLYVMIIIGLFGWTSIARFIRAELLRIRQLEYIEATEAFGYPNWRIILKHAIPNALAPVLIAIAFGVASAILTEAFLSFLGIGVPADQVTWGSMLQLSRDKHSAWWLAVFPGLAIFITVTTFNLLGEGLTNALDPKQQNN